MPTPSKRYSVNLADDSIKMHDALDQIAKDGGRVLQVILRPAHTTPTDKDRPNEGGFIIIGEYDL